MTDSLYLSARGMFVPALNITGPATAMVVLIVIMLAGILFWIGLGKRFMFDGFWRKVSLSGSALAATLILVTIICAVSRIPETPLLSVPELKGFNFRGGMSMPPELSAILFATMFYGAAYIAEIVRGGFLSVDSGKVEAGRALGMSGWLIFSRIQLPITVQNILPMMTNLYVWLIKATTLGVAVGFSDLFAVTVSSINQSGQTIEFILILALAFWLLNNGLVWVMNVIGTRLHRSQVRCR